MTFTQQVVLLLFFVLLVLCASAAFLLRKRMAQNRVTEQPEPMKWLNALLIGQLAALLGILGTLVRIGFFFGGLSGSVSHTETEVSEIAKQLYAGPESVQVKLAVVQNEIGHLRNDLKEAEKRLLGAITTSRRVQQQNRLDLDQPLQHLNAQLADLLNHLDEKDPSRMLMRVESTRKALSDVRSLVTDVETGLKNYPDSESSQSISNGLMNLKDQMQVIDNVLALIASISK